MIDNDIPEIIKKQYKIKEKLGAGGFGVVLKAKNKFDKQEYALKFLRIKNKDKCEEDYKKFKEEVRTMAKLRHKHIIQYHPSIFLDEQKVVIIIMDLAEKSLSSILDTLTTDEAFTLFKQLCKGIKYLHCKEKMIHQDVKPENILLKDNEIKISDFGLTKFTTNKETSWSGFATPDYMAPEQLKEEEKITKKVDIWALGIIFHQMLSKGVHPFGIKKKEKKMMMMKGHFKLNSRIKDSRAIKIIEGCLEIDPNKRIKIEDILRILEQQQMKKTIEEKRK